MKYIIDIPKEYESDWVNKSSRLGFELCFPINETATNKKYHIPTGLKLEPYTEPDRKAIEDEVWGLVGVIANMNNNDYGRVFGCIGRWTLLSKKTYQEAKARYDSWKQEKEDIHVGDEVEDNDGTRGIVFDIIGTDLLGVCWEEERVSHFFWPKSYCRKTGRHFDEVDELLKKMRGDKE